ncbi:uncharacterized protein V1513DRAFT_438594 [Lipomyces chichibuensis]|uniref:uncharacterized protein n=1 Tax=Lipomyces chichibuensis TaxID=1546026 RepID=UPI00334416E4
MAPETWRRSSTSSIPSGSPVCYTRSSSLSTYGNRGPLDESLYECPSPFSFTRASTMSLPVSPSTSRPSSPPGSPSIPRKSSIPRRESASASLSAFARLNLGRRPSVAERADMVELTRLIRSEGNSDSQNSEEISRVVRQILDFSGIRTERGNRFHDRRRQRSASQAVGSATEDLPVGFKDGWGWRLSSFDERSSSRERKQSRSTSRIRTARRRNARCCCASGSCGGERGYGVLRCRQRSLSPTSM